MSMLNGYLVSAAAIHNLLLLYHNDVIVNIVVKFLIHCMSFNK